MGDICFGLPRQRNVCCVCAGVLLTHCKQYHVYMSAAAGLCQECFFAAPVALSEKASMCALQVVLSRPALLETARRLLGGVAASGSGANRICSSICTP